MWQNIDLQWFAAEDEGRTEEATETKLRKAREEGRVAKSQEISSSLVLLAVVLMLIATAKKIYSLCQEILVFYITRSTTVEPDSGILAVGFFSYFARIIIPIALVGGFAAIMANLVQNRGFILSFKPIEPQFSKVVPNFGRYFKRTLLSFEGVWNVLKSLGKVILVSFIAYLLIKKDLPAILELIRTTSIRLATFRIASMVAQLLIICTVIFIVLSIPDYVIQRRQFMESMKMTKQEVKQEFKEQEGDPEVKGRLEQAQKALLQQNIPKAVAESDVVITNPTHFAVALKYDNLVDDAPKINAKGEDELAFRIRTIAQENNIPVIENRPLARSLYTNFEVNDTIDESYLTAIALIYKEIGYKLKT